MTEVGPNTVIQLFEALRSLRPDVLGTVAAWADAEAWLAAPPHDMIDEAVPRRLFAATADALVGDADRVLAAAGAATARYLLANRIPPVARAVLPRLPRRLALRLLLAAVDRASWTFAGSGTCATEGRALTIAGNPIATPGCPWHLGVLEALATALFGRGTTVVHTACCARGDPVCRFEFGLAQRPLARHRLAPST